MSIVHTLLFHSYSVPFFSISILCRVHPSQDPSFSGYILFWGLFSLGRPFRSYILKVYSTLGPSFSFSILLQIHTSPVHYSPGSSFFEGLSFSRLYYSLSPYNSQSKHALVHPPPFSSSPGSFFTPGQSFSVLS